MLEIEMSTFIETLSGALVSYESYDEAPEDVEQVYGSIEIKANGKVVVERSAIDLICPLWCLFVNAIELNCMGESYEGFYPSNAVPLSLYLSGNNIRMKVFNADIVLPKEKVIKEVLDRSEEFFLNMPEKFGQEIEIPVQELEVIQTCRNMLNQSALHSEKKVTRTSGFYLPDRQKR